MPSRKRRGKAENEKLFDERRPGRAKDHLTRSLGEVERLAKRLRGVDFDTLREGDLVLVTIAADSLVQAIEPLLLDEDERARRRKLYRSGVI